MVPHLFHSGISKLHNLNMEVERNWTDDQLEGDGVSKKDLVTYLQEHASLNVGSRQQAVQLIDMPS